MSETGLFVYIAALIQSHGVKVKIVCFVLQVTLQISFDVLD